MDFGRYRVYSRSSLRLRYTRRSFHVTEWRAPSHPEEVIGIVCRLGIQFDDEAFSRFPGLKWLATPTTGLTHLDLGSARSRNVRIFSLRDIRSEIQSITSTPELALALAICLIRGVHKASMDVQAGHWDRDNFIGRQLSSMNIGVLGFGRIGKQVSRVIRALGAEVRFLDSVPLRPEQGEKPVSVEEFWASSELVFIAVSADAGNVVTRRELQKLPRGSYLVNVARGEVIDENSVVKLLEDGHLAGYATDVLRSENAPGFLTESVIMDAQRRGFNVLVTPHIGGATRDAMRSTEVMLARYVTSQLAGGLE